MLKKIFTLTIFLFLFAANLFSFSEEDFNQYLRLNDEEQRLLDYKDSAEILRIKLVQLDYINLSRKKYGAKPVRLDILASRVANRMAMEGAMANFHGHWNTRGEKPYHRYAFAGGLDHVSENAAAYWSSSNLLDTAENKLKLMKESHDRFMAEVPPYDGHKLAVINKDHNYVGLGCWIAGTQFRYYEEYIDRYLEFEPVKRELKIDEESEIVVKPLERGKHVFAALCYYEPPLKSMTPAEINRKSSYNDYSSTKIFSLWPWQLKSDPKTGKTTIPVKFSREGLYYIHIYLSNTKYTGGRASTAGKIISSSIVIKVGGESVTTGSEQPDRETGSDGDAVAEVSEDDNSSKLIKLLKSENIKTQDSTSMMSRVKRLTIQNSFKCYNIKVVNEDDGPVAYLLTYDSRIKSCGYRYIKLNLTTYKSAFLEAADVPVRFIPGKISRVDLDNDGLKEEVEIGGNGHDSGLIKVSSGSKLLGYRENWGNLKSELSFIDLNADGIKEIIVGDIQDTSIHIFGYDSKGERIVEKQAYIFSGYSGFGRVPSLGTGDIDGDNRTELLFGVGRRERGEKSGLYSPRYGWLYLSKGNDYVTGIDTFDLDGDGKDEIIFTTYNSKIYILTLNR